MLIVYGYRDMMVVIFFKTDSARGGFGMDETRLTLSEQLLKLGGEDAILISKYGSSSISQTTCPL